MRVDMKGFLTQPVPKKGGTVKCFIRREKEFVSERKYAEYVGPKVYLLHPDIFWTSSLCGKYGGWEKGTYAERNN